VGDPEQGEVRWDVMSAPFGTAHDLYALLPQQEGWGGYRLAAIAGKAIVQPNASELLSNPAPKLPSEFSVFSEGAADMDSDITMYC
jgi:hypothetical protein